MPVTRRQFLHATTAAAVTAATAAGRPAAVRKRKDINTLTAASPDVVAMKTAVGRMKANQDAGGNPLGAADGRRWSLQAGIHGTPLAFGKCQHGNWFFLPWHRIYLYHFEEIVRALSGNDEFALPYWDWTKDRTLPALFWGTDNPLDNPPAGTSPGAGRRPGLTQASRIEDPDYNRLFSPTVITRLLNTADFETFAGGRVTMPGQSAFQGGLERGPHNRAHTWVGGDMGTGASPWDPVFWLHHCNVDRLWASWAGRHPAGTPADMGWRGTAFADFYGRDGAAVPAGDRVTVGKALVTTDLGYEYDRLEGPPPPPPGGGARARVFGSASAAAPMREASTAAFAVAATAEFARLVGQAAAAPPDAPGGSTVRLRIAGLKPPADPATVLDVYLNCEKLSADTPITDPSYVGSCAFFTHGKHADGHGHDAGGVVFALDLTPDVARLYGNRPLKADERLKVGVVARKPADKEGFVPAEIESIAPDRVHIEVVGTAG